MWFTGSEDGDNKITRWGWSGGHRRQGHNATTADVLLHCCMIDIRSSLDVSVCGWWYLHRACFLCSLYGKVEFSCFQNKHNNMTEVFQNKNPVCVFQRALLILHWVPYKSVLRIMSSSKVIWREVVGVRHLIDVTQDLELSSGQWMKKIQENEKMTI